MVDQKRLLEVIDKLNSNPLFEELVEWIEDRNQRVLNKLRSEHDNMILIFQLQGGDIELSEILKTIKTARERLMEIKNQTPKSER